MDTQLQLALDQRTPLNPIWTFGANTCHAALWLRPDLLRHLEMGRRELGFRYIRAHNLFGNELGVVRPDGGFDFTKIDIAFDRLLSLGLRPFVELSSMPEAFASAPTTITHYDFRTAPPRDWQAWSRLIRALTVHLTERYGESEIREWYFEVWNEPDLPFWSGTQADYFRLYDLSAAAIKSVNPAYRVGGPATSKTAWIDEFLAHVTQPAPDDPRPGTRCDFVSTHAYPSDVAFLNTAHGAVTLQHSNIMGELFAEVRRKVNGRLGAGFPVICGEWNSSAGPLAENHDTCNNAAFVVKTLVELSTLCQGSLFWNLSDIYEECLFHHEPFHGGYGLLTVNDLPKAAYHGFRLLARHQGDRIPVLLEGIAGNIGGLATLHKHRLALTLWHHQEPDQSAAEPIHIQLPACLTTAHAVRLERIRPGQGSAFETWLALGSPSFANASLLATLEAASRPSCEFGPLPAHLDLPPGELLHLEASLRPETTA